MSLSSLEDGADDFEKIMIQQARDDERLRPQAFRKARTRPRVGVTLENLERHNAIDRANAQFQSNSPPSSNDSARSDPALQPPSAWGRKARLKRNWIRTIVDEDQSTPNVIRENLAADTVRPSVEDSPLSRKSSVHGTPASTRGQDWDFDLNEASLIASTPYLPRSTALDEIRLRELESLGDQAATNSGLGSMKEDLPKVQHRKEDSHELLRRLARLSHTPSPARTVALGPQPASSGQPEGFSQAEAIKAPLPPVAVEIPIPTAASAGKTFSLEATGTRTLSAQALSNSSPQPLVENASTTPMRSESFIRNSKTPVVTGAWVDTVIESPYSVAKPDVKQNLEPSSATQVAGAKILPSEESKQAGSSAADQDTALRRPPRPGPRSALEAIVEEARSSGRYPTREYGDSTINSLEELISPMANNPETSDPDEDTLQGLQLPSTAPRNETERRQQDEVRHLHRMNDRLRATRTSIRNTSRHIGRVNEQVEHATEGVQDRASSYVTHHDCPCAIHSGHQSPLWTAMKGMFYDERLKPSRRGWGLTMLSISLIIIVTWFVLENVAWYVPDVRIQPTDVLTRNSEIWCHYPYASSYQGYGVTWNAPKFPYVIPTVIYRNFIRVWWRPIWGIFCWIWTAIAACFWGSTTQARDAVTSASATVTTNSIFSTEQAIRFEEDSGAVLGMDADEVVI